VFLLIGLAITLLRLDQEDTKRELEGLRRHAHAHAI